MLISNEYREQNAEIHRDSATWGITPDGVIEDLKQLFVKFQPLTILDYGCGKGRVGKVFFNVQSYDPAIPEFATTPVPADFVICTSMLEHVEPESLEHVLGELEALTKKVIFLRVSTYPASKVLSDGRNAHLIQEPFEWWLPKLLERWNLYLAQVHDGGAFTFVGTPRKCK